MKTPEQPLHFQNREEWRAWLQENHTAQKEVWLVILRSRAKGPGMHLEEATEEAVCFGWVDSVMKSAHADFFYLRFSPRKPDSIWSLSNQRRVERMAVLGKMAEAGLEKVREARANGEWEAAIRRENINHLSDDLRAALNENEAARANFEKLPASQKKMCLYWIASAKTQETRRRRILETVEKAANNEKKDF